jgi:hypothetical protein
MIQACRFPQSAELLRRKWKAQQGYDKSYRDAESQYQAADRHSPN